jgi:WD40 repeat protein
MNKLSAAIVRILNQHGETAGTGFVVSSDGLVTTCAHVVEYAGAGPGETVRIIFHDSGDEQKAMVEPAFWRDASTQDIAILRLEGPLPGSLHPVSLGDAAGTDDHQVRTFGFPAVKPVDGMPGKGEVIGSTSENGSQVLMIRSPEITPGFSGAPLLDLLTGRVIGMVSSIAPPDQYLRQGTTAFATPTKILRQVCAVLELFETCPYRGLQAFTEEDAAVFFGRKAFVKKLVEKLKQEPSFLAVLGPSGSGKSSLVQAGLVPLLRQGKLQRSDHWGVVIIRPTHDPFEQFSREALASPSHDLRMAIQEWFQQNPHQEGLVLIIDQFEELFTSCPPSLSQLFVNQLTQLLDSPEALTIILTMRDEFYSQFAQHAAKLVRWLERGTANVPSTLTQDELIEIVQAPAANVGLNFETGLIETIVKDATDVVLNQEGERGGRSTILPLLEFALTQLWQERHDGFLTHEAFTEKVGGVTGGLTNWATRELKRKEASQRPLALRILTDLVYLGDEHQGIPDTRRRRQLTSLWRNEEEREAVQRIVQHLVEARLLVTSGDTVEIIHDALLREWKQLRDRLRDDHLILAWRQGIEGRVSRWVETAPDDINSRDKGKLLRGGDLSEAEGMLAERVYDLNATERAFVEESIALRNHEEAEQKAQRQRELQRAQELEQALARANKERAVSESQWLAFASRSVSASAPETALLLACEAVRWDHNPLSEDVLRDALNNTPWQVTAFTGHENWITSAIFSLDGQRILTASDDGTARLWDLLGTCLARYQGHKKRVTSAIFSPDEKRILTTSQDGTARLWHPDGQSIMTLTYPSKNKSGEYGRIKSTFSPDGRYMLICDRDEAWLWDADGNLQPTTWDTRPLMDAYYTRLKQSLLHGRYLNDDLRKRAINEGHNGRIYTAVFSPDGQKILTASSDETARVWDLAGQQLAILREHTDQVINAVLSSDGQLILTGSLDKTARLWTSSGELLATLEGHRADVGHLAFSPDSQLMLTGVDGGPEDDAVPRLWDRSGKLVATLIGHSFDDRIMDITFSPDGQRILTASRDKTARIWDLEGRPLAVLRGHLSGVWRATFSPNGQSILTASGDPEPRLWEPDRSPLALIEGHKGAVTGAIYNEAGTHILTSSRDETTRLWDTAGGCIAAYNGTAELLTENVLSPDGRYLLTYENDSGQVHQWQLPPGIRWLDQHSSRDGTLSTANRATHRRDRFDAGNGVSDAPLITFTVGEKTRSGFSGVVKSAVFSPDGTRILIHAYSNTQIRDRHGQLLAVLNGPNQNKKEALSVDYVMFSPDSQHVVTASINGSVWLWTRGGQLITSFLTDDKSAHDNLFSVTFSPDGQRILTTIRQSADLWDLNGRHLTNLPCNNTNKVKRAQFSPDGDRILTVAEAYFSDMRLWDRNGNFITELHTSYGDWAPICFGQQGKQLCTVDKNIAKIWDRDGSVVAALVIDRETWITQITFSSDEEQLLLGTSSGIVQLWSLRDGGKLLSTFKGHTSEVKSIVFSPDGRRVLTASTDGTTRQFLVHADDLLAAASRRVGRSLDAQEIARFNVPTPLRFDPKV